MQHNQQQIEKVWKETMTAAAKKAFLADFLLHESAWKLTLEKEYYQHIKEATTNLSPARSAHILQQLHEQILKTSNEQPGNRVVTIRPYIQWAAAAAIIAIIATTVWLAMPTASKPTTVAKQTQRTDSLTLQQNNTADNKIITLQDGSQVTLSPHSAIKYYQPFRNNKRDISLLGQATFKVAKDSTQPFTVFANEMATTALGTEFMVNAQQPNQVHIQLYEGKVVIQSAAKKLPMEKVYLKPGEQFSINKDLKQFTVSKFNNTQRNLAVATQQPKSKAKTTPALPPLEFTQTPLPEVLAQLSQRYNVHFTYNIHELTNEQVTGRFLPTDSLHAILSMLGTVNGLSFKTKADGITVQKVK